jgi:hypothetical protein
MSSQELPTYTRTFPTFVFFYTLVQPMLTVLLRNRKSMHFPASPNSELSHGVLPDSFQISTLHHIHFSHEFCYLGCIITTDHSDDREITVRIRKQKRNKLEP